MYSNATRGEVAYTPYLSNEYSFIEYVSRKYYKSILNDGKRVRN